MARVIARRISGSRRTPQRIPSGSLDSAFGDAFVDPLDQAVDDDELALALEMRDRQAEQRRLRAQVLTDLGERVEVRCRLHLLDADAEAMLLGRLREFDDRLAVLRHCCDHTDRLAVEARDETHRLQIALAAQADTVVVELAVAIGRPPRGGADWSLGDVPAAALDDIADAWAALRRDLVRVVDHLVSSDLVRAVGASQGMVDVVLREHDAESVERVRAFIAEVRRLDELAVRCTERVRRIALRSAHAHPRNWLAQNQLRSRQAREALDMVRAVHAARAELETVTNDGTRSG
jgi:hypothetical protein